MNKILDNTVTHVFKSLSRYKGVCLLALCWLLVLGWWSCPLSARTTSVLPEIMKATAIDVDTNRIYITQDTTIFIYSAKDYKFIKKFGSSGEGPGEFKTFVDITLQPDHLLINSGGKISYFSKGGVFIKELKPGAAAGSSKFFPIGNGFVGKRLVRKEGEIFPAVFLFDARLTKGKEIYRLPVPLMKRDRIDLLSQSLTYRTWNDKIFVAGKDGFVIDVLDQEGKLVFAIQQEYSKRPVTTEDKKNFHDLVKEVYKQHYEVIKNRLVFPEYFPAILDFFIDNHKQNQKLYVATWNIKNNKIKFFIYDLKGHLISEKYIPFHFENALQPFPAAIKNGKLYQVVENEAEDWVLHCSAID